MLTEIIITLFVVLVVLAALICYSAVKDPNEPEWLEKYEDEEQSRHVSAIRRKKD